MFFILSKLLAFITYPLVWMLVALSYGFYTKNRKRKKRSFILAGSLFLFFSNAVILDLFMLMWEVPGKKAETVQHYDVAIVLGGMTEWDSHLERLSFRRGSDRLWQTVDLYLDSKVDKILISGAHGSIYEDGLKESLQLRNYLVKLGIPQQDILIETESRNTHENATFSKKILEEQLPLAKNILLVTSGSHMRRARACFREAGMEVDTYSTDMYTGSGPYVTFERLLLPNIEVISGWNQLIHEVTGYCIYLILGYI